MPRPRRYCPPGVTQHILQRGNNRQACFLDKIDFAYYLEWLRRYAHRHRVALHALVLMTNHVHLLATPGTGGSISLMMQDMGRRYVGYFNHRYQRTGTLLEGRFKTHLIDSDEYLLSCQRYIELNPVRAGVVQEPGDYAWSSYGCNALGKASRILTAHPLYLALGATTAERTAAYRELFKQSLDAETLKEIRTSISSSQALGSDRFISGMEALVGGPLRHRPSGRPPRKQAD